MAATCRSCWFLCGTVADTCPRCGYHQRTKGRTDGKRNKQNSEESNDRARRNLKLPVKHTYIPVDLVAKKVKSLISAHGSMKAAASYIGVDDRVLQRFNQRGDGTLATCTAIRILGDDIFLLEYPEVPLCTHKGHKPLGSPQNPLMTIHCHCERPIHHHNLDDDEFRCVKCGLPA